MAVMNSLINMNILNNCVNRNIKCLITIGSSCCYPIDAQQPFEESSYGPGQYESTNSNYALSKIIMSEAIEASHQKSDLRYKTIIMCNLFGYQEKEDTNHYHLINAIADKCKTALQKDSNAISIEVQAHQGENLMRFQLQDLSKRHSMNMKIFRQKGPWVLHGSQCYRIL